MLAQVHESHQGIIKCKQRARETLFWPGMCTEIEKLVENCSKCQTFRNQQHKETMKPTPLPELPWMELASDIFDWEREQYLLTIDYYSRYIEVDKLPDQSSKSTIETLKSQFARHGIPEKLRTDNGPQYSSREFSDFCNEYGIQHTTSSPLYPQSNGEAERAVQTVNVCGRSAMTNILALLNYRTTPLKGLSFSPAQLLMSRRPRNKIPATRQLLQPKTVDIKDVKQCAAKEKAIQQLVL
jgi:transposase InsO family protein